MGIPVVIKPSGGLPVTVATNGYGLPMTEAANGFGLAVTEAASGGGLAVVGITFGPTLELSASSVLETAAVNTVVGTLSLTPGTTGTPVYTLADSAGGKFNISGTSLRTNALLDYETASSHSVTVAVSGVTPAVANRSFTISVTDVLEPVIVLTGTTVNEDAATNTTVGTLSIANTYTGTPVYSLTDSAGGKFNISGALLRTNAALDYETAATHSVTVAVSGITPAAANKAFTIVVLDVTESATTAWNPADKDASLTLSSGNLTVTKTNDASHAAIRSVASASSGKIYWELTMTTISNSGYVSQGMGNSAASLSYYLGSTADSIGWAGDGNVYGGAGVIAHWVAGDTLCFALDLDNSRMWFRANGGGWNNDVLANQNPATNTGGMPLSSLAPGPYFAMCNLYNLDNSITANFGATSYSQTPPAGFGNWSGGGGGLVGDTKNIVSDYGAVGDAQWAQATLSISTNVLTSATPVWTGVAGDYVGKSIVLPTPSFGAPHVSTISGLTSSMQITLATSTAYPFTALDGIVAWGTDNTAAFVAFKTAYQGDMVTLTIPAGKYLVGAGGNIQGLWDGIRNITVNATGATICGAYFQIQASAQYEAAGHSARTASVTAGATFVTLTTPSQVSRFVVGNYALMTGFDLQHSGYPTNQSLFEYLLITAIDSDSGSPTYGKITFLTPLANSYLSTWPVYNASGTDYGGPATLYAMDPKFNHTSVVNGLTVAQQNQYGVSGRSLTFNNCVFEGVGQIGPHPTMAKTVVFNNCTGLGLTLELDKLVSTLTITGGTWHTLYMQSVAIDLLTIDSCTVTGSFVGSARKTVMTDSTIANWSPGPIFFGYAHELDVSDSTISVFTTSGAGALIKGGTSANNSINVDLNMTAGVITIPSAMRTTGSGQWAVSDEKMFFTDELVGTIGSFTITNVADGPSGSILVTTDWSGGFPSRAYNPTQGLFLRRHPAPACTFTNVSGCAEVVDLSNAGAAGLPINAYTKRTYTGSSDSGHYLQVWGRFKYIKVTVTTPYTGSIGTVTATLGNSNNAGIKASDGTNTTAFQPVINLKVAGVRTFDATAGTYPVSWTGAQTGDTLPSQTEALWCGGNFITQITDVSSSPGGTPMAFTVECITDQGFA